MCLSCRFKKEEDAAKSHSGTFFWFLELLGVVVAVVVVAVVVVEIIDNYIVVVEMVDLVMVVFDYLKYYSVSV